MDAPEITKLPHEAVAGERQVRTGVLSDADLARFAEQGYVVVPDAVPAENLRAMEELIWRFLDADSEDPDSWYRIAPREATGEAAAISRAGMVEVYQQQELWECVPGFPRRFAIASTSGCTRRLPTSGRPSSSG